MMGVITCVGPVGYKPVTHTGVNKSGLGELFLFKLDSLLKLELTAEPQNYVWI